MSAPTDGVFSREHPDVRLVWDALTLTAYMKDPLSYYLRHVRGWREDVGADTDAGEVEDPEGEGSLPLTFGILYHEGVEMLWNGRPIEAVVAHIMGRAQELALDRLQHEAPATQARGRRTRDLVRALVWYADEREKRWRHEMEMVAQEQVMVAELQPARASATWPAEPVFYAGRIDAQARSLEDGHPFVIERKTTNQTITSSSYWNQWRSSLQVWGYDWLVGGPPTMSGRVAIEACQTGATFARVETEVVTRTPEQRAYVPEVLRYWIGRATRDAIEGRWMPNLSLRFPGDWSAKVAVWAPETRDDRLRLEGDFTRRVWDPRTGSRVVVGGETT